MKKSDINPMPEYFDRYINLVEDIELSKAFDESIIQLDSLDRNTLNRLEGKQYAPDKWTVKDIFQHLIDVERVLVYRTLRFARRDGVVPLGFDENLIAKNANASQRSLDKLITELKIQRASTQLMFESFTNEMLLAKGINWKHEISVLAMGFNIIGHQIHHLKIIEERYFPLVNT